MKQLNIVVSPTAFVWDPYFTLTNVTIDPDPCDLWPWYLWPLTSNSSRDMNFYLVNFYLMNYFLVTDGMSTGRIKYYRTIGYGTAAKRGLHAYAHVRLAMDDPTMCRSSMNSGISCIPWQITQHFSRLTKYPQSKNHSSSILQFIHECWKHPLTVVAL